MLRAFISLLCLLNVTAAVADESPVAPANHESISESSGIESSKSSEENQFADPKTATGGSPLSGLTHSQAKQVREPKAPRRQAYPAVNLVHFLSPRFREIGRRIASLNRELQGLPIGASDNRSVSLGHHTHVIFSEEQPYWIEIDLGAEKKFDALAILPVSVLSPLGDMRLDIGYGFPKRFKVEVQSADRATTQLIIDETQKDYPNPGRYPYLHEFNKPVTGRYVKITSVKHWKVLEHWVVALSEIMVLHGKRNLAYQKKVSLSGMRDINAAWRKENLTDLQSPLGPPVLPEVSPTNGIHTIGTKKEFEEKWIQIDLEASYPIHHIRLFPSRPTDFADLPGLGFPVKYRLEISDDPEMVSRQLIYQSKTPVLNPGDNMVIHKARGKKGRYLRMTAEQLMKRTTHFTFTMSEIEVESFGKNVALGKPVTATALFMNPRFPRWFPEALVDGYNSQNKITDLRTWLRGLDKRKQIEADIDELIKERVNVRENTLFWLIITVTALSLTLICFFTVTTIRGRRERIRRTERIRQQIASDLHDDIGSNLGAISLLTEAAADRDDLPADLKELLVDVKEIASSTSMAMRDIVWLIQKGEVSLVEVYDRLGDTVRQMLAGTDHELSVVREGLETRKLTLETRRHMFLAFKEVLHNIQKHADASHVAIKMGLDESRRQAYFIVEDNGKGFVSDEVADKGNGLRSLAERAEKTGGKLEMESAPGKGTAVRFHVPTQR